MDVHSFLDRLMARALASSLEAFGGLEERAVPTVMGDAGLSVGVESEVGTSQEGVRDILSAGRLWSVLYLCKLEA